MKIAMFGHKRIPSREGGVEVVVEALSTQLARDGHSVVCYNRRGHHVSGAVFDSNVEKLHQGVRLITVPTLDWRGLAAVTSSFFAAFFSAVSAAEVVHIHAEGPAWMCWIPKLFGKRVIVTVHGLDWKREKWKHSFAARYIRSGEQMAVRYADEIIVLSRNVQQYFLAEYGRKTVWIPNGVGAAERVPAERINADYGLKRDGFILFLGRLVPEKEIHCLIRAFRNVVTDKKLVIAGGSSDTDDYCRDLKAMAAKDERILFTGFVRGRILQELYSNAYLYVLPSAVEGMPLSLLEAMSYGNCCLVSDIPECVEVLGDCGETFRKGNTEDLTKQLQRLCNDEAGVRYRKQLAADTICMYDDWEKITKKTMELYQ